MLIRVISFSFPAIFFFIYFGTCSKRARNGAGQRRSARQPQPATTVQFLAFVYLHFFALLVTPAHRPPAQDDFEQILAFPTLTTYFPFAPISPFVRQSTLVTATRQQFTPRIHFLVPYHSY